MFKVSGNVKHEGTEGVTRRKRVLEVSEVMYCGPIWVKMIEFAKEFYPDRGVGCLKCYTVGDFEQKMLFFQRKMGGGG